MNDYVDDKGQKFEAGLTKSDEIVATNVMLGPPSKQEIPKDVFATMKIHGQMKNVVHLRETNPGHFTIVDGHGIIGQAMSDKKNLVPVWFEKRSGTVEKFNLNLATYQLEPYVNLNKDPDSLAY